MQQFRSNAKIKCMAYVTQFRKVLLVFRNVRKNFGMARFKNGLVCYSYQVPIQLITWKLSDWCLEYQWRSRHTLQNVVTNQAKIFDCHVMAVHPSVRTHTQKPLVQSSVQAFKVLSPFIKQKINYVFWPKIAKKNSKSCFSLINQQFYPAVKMAIGKHPPEATSNLFRVFREIIKR